MDVPERGAAGADRWRVAAKLEYPEDFLEEFGHYDNRVAGRCYYHPEGANFFVRTEVAVPLERKEELWEPLYAACRATRLAE